MSQLTPPRPPRERLVDVLACFIRSGVSAVVIGTPGTGKSATVQAMAKAFGWDYRRKGVPGMTDPVLFMGLPGQDGDNTYLKPFPWLRSLIDANAKGERTVLLWDDIAETSRTIQSFLLDVLSEHVIGDHSLELTSMIGTANPVGGGLQITPAMANRVGHIRWDVTPKEHAALMQGDYPLPNIPIFEDDWEARLPMARREIAGFLQTTQDFDAPDLDGAQTQLVVGAYPSPRTWEYAARLLAVIDGSDMDAERARQVKIIALKSLVGDVAAGAYFTFLQYPDMPTPEDALRNPQGIMDRAELFDTNRPDRGYIFLNAMTRYALSNGSLDAWQNAWRILGLFADRECAVLASAHAMVLSMRRPEGAEDVPEMQDYDEVLRVGDEE